MRRCWNRISFVARRHGLLTAAVALACLLGPDAVRAQPAPSNLDGGYWAGSGCNAVTFGAPNGPRVLMVDANGNLCVSSTSTASIAGFAPNGNFSSPMAVTGTTSEVALPSGAVVVVQNVGAQTAYVNLGSSASVTATTSDFAIPAGSSVALTVGSNTNIAAITSTSTTTLNMAAGTGLFTAAGGGGSGGGGGGNVTIIGPLGQNTSASSVPVVVASDQSAVPTKLNATPSLVNGSGVVPTQGGAVLSATNGGFTNILQGNAALATGNPLFAQLTAGSALAGKFGIDQTTVGTTNAISLADIGAAAVSTGAGVTGTGTQRVGVAQDTTTIAGSAPGVAGTASTNVVTVQGVTSMTPVQVSQATAASLNATVVGTGTFATQAAQSGTWNVTNVSGTVSLPTGAATAANQTNASAKTQLVDGSGNVIGATSNNLNVQCANCSGSGVSTGDEATFTAGTSLFAGSGGFFQTTATSNPLTTGQQGLFQVTAQRALFSNLRNASGTEIGTAAAPLQVSVANTAANATAMLVTGTGGTFPVSQATASSLNATVVQATGSNLHVTCDSGCSSSSAPADEATFTAGTTSQTPVGGFFQTTATSNPLTTGQMGALQVTANRALFTNLRNASGTEIGTSTTPVQVSVANTGANATAMLVTGTGGTFPATESGTWTVQPGNTANSTAWLVTGTGGTFPITAASLPLPTGASTSALQPTNATIGSTTSGQTGNLAMGATTTSNPVYTTAQTNPISLDTAGGQRIAGEGSAGTATGGVLTVQGVASMTPVQVSQATASNLNANITNISGTVSLPTGAATAANQTSVIGTLAAGTSATNSMLAGGVFHTTPPTVTNNQQVALQVDAAGNLMINSAIAHAPATTPVTSYASGTNLTTATFNGTSEDCRTAIACRFWGTLTNPASAVFTSPAVANLQASADCSTWFTVSSAAASTTSSAVAPFSFNWPYPVACMRVQVTGNVGTTATVTYAIQAGLVTGAN